MKIKGSGVGWEKVHPLEGYEEVSCEIKRLSLEEKMDFLEMLADTDKDKPFRFGSKQGREMFRKYVRDIDGIEWAGKRITKPDELLDPAMPHDDGLVLFITECVAAFWSMQFPDEEEVKNSETPSDTLSSEAGGPQPEVPGE